ncbi:MAG: potassium-transporting ATPase subunit C [Euryarchaeota archaeon]|nr:potassium-transporting ATPase subunit C [Euryarchaeota archaeon]MBU4220589.1 potassium-transporting ATPase subunit C [Euryarchaeota archaeon]MCG2736817.1 potassium-transporting ATPase subunit C [Candidatus Methanoperedenaceae archaeon]
MTRHYAKTLRNPDCVLVGIIYHVAVTALARLFFPKEAGGSLLYDSGGNLTGSALIGQPFFMVTGERVELN